MGRRKFGVQHAETEVRTANEDETRVREEPGWTFLHRAKAIPGRRCQTELGESVTDECRM